MIFLYRKGSIQPFTKGLPSAQLLDCLTEVLVETESNGGVQVREEALDIMHTCLQKARDCNEQHLLLRIPYMTLFEYLQVGAGLLSQDPEMATHAQDLLLCIPCLMLFKCRQPGSLVTGIMELSFQDA